MGQIKYYAIENKVVQKGYYSSNKNVWENINLPGGKPLWIDTNQIFISENEEKSYFNRTFLEKST